MTTIQLTCDVCNTPFRRTLSEHNRCKKRGHNRTFCSRKCAIGKLKSNLKVGCGPHDHLDPANRRDEFSPFRWHLRNAVRRGHHECDLTLEYLKELWENQDGKCAYTGWALKNMPNTAHCNQLPLTPDRASLDRKDSGKGYIQGNVQFVCVMAQYAKHTFDDDQLIDFCESVVGKNLSLLR